MARTGQRQKGARRTAPPKQRRVRHNSDVVSVLSRTVREVEAAVQRGRVTPAVRTKFQAVAMLLRDERARVQAAPVSGSHRAEQLKRLDGIAAILATTAVRDTGLLALLAEDARVSDAARSLKREMMRELGLEPAPARVLRMLDDRARDRYLAQGRPVTAAYQPDHDIWFRYRDERDLDAWFRLLPGLLPGVLGAVRNRLG